MFNFFEWGKLADIFSDTSPITGWSDLHTRTRRNFIDDSFDLLGIKEHIEYYKSKDDESGFLQALTQHFNHFIPKAESLMCIMLGSALAVKERWHDITHEDYAQDNIINPSDSLKRCRDAGNLLKKIIQYIKNAEDIVLIEEEHGIREKHGETVDESSTSLLKRKKETVPIGLNSIQIEIDFYGKRYPLPSAEIILEVVEENYRPFSDKAKEFTRSALEALLVASKPADGFTPSSAATKTLN